MYVIDPASFKPKPIPIIKNAALIAKIELANQPSMIQPIINGMLANSNDFLRPNVSLIIHPTMDPNGCAKLAKLAVSEEKTFYYGNELQFLFQTNCLSMMPATELFEAFHRD